MISKQLRFLRGRSDKGLRSRCRWGSDDVLGPREGHHTRLHDYASVVKEVRRLRYERLGAVAPRALHVLAAGRAHRGLTGQAASSGCAVTGCRQRVPLGATVRAARRGVAGPVIRKRSRSGATPCCLWHSARFVVSYPRSLLSPATSNLSLAGESGTVKPPSARTVADLPKSTDVLAGFEKVALLGGQYVPLESRRPGDSERVRGVSVD